MLGQFRSCFYLLKFNELACYIRSLKILGSPIKRPRAKERLKERKNNLIGTEELSFFLLPIMGLEELIVLTRETD